MPASVINESGYQLGQPIDAIISDLTIGGTSYRCTDAPVKVLVGERALNIDGSPPRLSNVGESGRAVLDRGRPCDGGPSMGLMSLEEVHRVVAEYDAAHPPEHPFDRRVREKREAEEAERQERAARQAKQRATKNNWDAWWSWPSVQ